MPSSAVQTCALDRKSTRLNSSHTLISYAVFCLKKNKLGWARGDGGTCRLLVRAEGRGLTVGAVLGDCARLRRVVPVEVGEPEREVFFFNDTGTTEIYPLSLPDALPI